MRGFPGIPGYLRAAVGPGWALVGDAGWYTDPIAAHGITAALRDAELLARAVLDGSPQRYEQIRDELSLPLLAVADRIASYRWDLIAIRTLLVELSRVMRPEVDALLQLDRHHPQAA